MLVHLPSSHRWILTRWREHKDRLDPSEKGRVRGLLTFCVGTLLDYDLDLPESDLAGQSPGAVIWNHQQRACEGNKRLLRDIRYRTFGDGEDERLIFVNEPIHTFPTKGHPSPSFIWGILLGWTGWSPDWGKTYSLWISGEISGGMTGYYTDKHYIALDQNILCKFLHYPCSPSV